MGSDQPPVRGNKEHKQHATCILFASCFKSNGEEKKIEAIRRKKKTRSMKRDGERWGEIKKGRDMEIDGKGS